MRKGTALNRHNSNRGSFSAVFLFAVFLGLLCVIAFLWMQENQPADLPESRVKETRGNITISLTRAAETKPADTAAEINSQTSLEEQARQAAIEAQKAAAAAQASMEAAIAEANRIAAEAEAARIAAEAAQKAAEAEAAKKAAEAEAAKKAAAEEASKRAAEEAARKAAEEEAAKKAAEEAKIQASQEAKQSRWVLDTGSQRIHSPSCSLLGSIPKENRVPTDATFPELLSQGYIMCEQCQGGATASDSIHFPDDPKVGVSGKPLEEESTGVQPNPPDLWKTDTVSLPDLPSIGFSNSSSPK